MNKSLDQYYMLRFQSADNLHRKGDIQNVDERNLFVGQTPECGLKIASHPELADCCYAVIVKNEDKPGWRIIRQEKEADITVNGTPLELVRQLNDHDLLKFDHTLVQFEEKQGERPKVQYIPGKPSWMVWTVLAVILLSLGGIVSFLYLQNQKPIAIFKREISSICKIEADTLIVLSNQGDTLEVVLPDHPMVGTGFITDNGYFVTARHCVEFWLAMENELLPDPQDIHSEVVRKAIDAETDSTIRLVARLKITSNDEEKTWYFSSDDFVMDKSRDNIYEYGGFETQYLWRSVVSLYEKRGAELGDVAVMKWPYGKGAVHLENPDVEQQANNKLYGFGYPQSDSRRSAVFSSVESNLYQNSGAGECFLCEKGLDSGFSGGPVFTRNVTKQVVGIVSRSDGSHTLMVPVSQIHCLINKIEKK